LDAATKVAKEIPIMTSGQGLLLGQECAEASLTTKAKVDPRPPKLNTGDFGGIWLDRATWFFRCRSFVDIATGSALPERKAQKTILEKQDDSLYKNERSSALWTLVEEKRAQIIKWESATAHGDEVAPDGDMLVTEFFETKFLPWVKRHKAVSTAKTYTLYWNSYLKEHFNHTKTLKNYESYMGTRLLETLCKKYSENTVRHIRALASAIFSYACAWGYLNSNPWREAKRTTAAQEVEATEAYTVNEVELILQALETIEGRESYSANLAGMMLTICFYAGLRPSEAAGLKWENVNLDVGTIYVKHAYVAGDFKGTKTGKNRTVVMLPQLRDRFKLWTLRRRDAEWVFPNQSGMEPIRVNDISSRVIKKACEKAGLDWKGLYAARRGFGTLMVLAGATLDEVADAMGNTPDVVFRHYFKDKKSTLAAKGIAKLQVALASEPERELRKTLELAGLAQ
jgi:integrase